MSKRQEDNLNEIRGIGMKTVKALNRIDVYTFSDLANFSPKALLKALKESGRTSPVLKEANLAQWIAAATELAKSVEAPDLTDAWVQQAGFSLFFDYKMEADETKWRWRTRINHAESDENVEFFDDDFGGWTDWIVDQAKLPKELLKQTAVSPYKPDAEQSLRQSQAPQSIAQTPSLTLEILSVEVSSETIEQMIVANVKFELSGESATALVNAKAPFHMTSYFRSKTEQQSGFVESAVMHLAPNKLSYEATQLLPIPENGQYEVQTAVSLRPLANLVAYYSGPIVEVALA